MKKFYKFQSWVWIASGAFQIRFRLYLSRQIIIQFYLKIQSNICIHTYLNHAHNSCSKCFSALMMNTPNILLMAEKYEYSKNPIHMCFGEMDC